MKLSILIASLLFFNTHYAQTLTFSNPDFLKALLDKHPEIDLNKDGKIQKKEASKVKKIDLGGQNLKDVQDVTKFKNVEYLSFIGNQLEELKLEDFKFLIKLFCGQNNLKTFEISKMPMLSNLTCPINQLTTLSISGCPNLTALNIMENRLISVDLSPFNKLKTLDASDNQLESLDISTNTELVQIIINNNHIKTIDITKNQKLDMTIQYIDKNVNIIGTKEQMSKYKYREVLISY